MVQEDDDPYKLGYNTHGIRNTASTGLSGRGLLLLIAIYRPLIVTLGGRRHDGTPNPLIAVDNHHQCFTYR